MAAANVEILSIEDSAADRYLIGHMFRGARRKCRVHFVEDGVQAMEFLTRQGKFSEAPRPDVILLDLNLPLKDGREVLREIKQIDALKDIPVVILTTSSNQQDINGCYHLNANCLITKPVEFSEFEKVIRTIEDFWVNTVHLPRSAATTA